MSVDVDDEPTEAKDGDDGCECECKRVGVLAPDADGDEAAPTSACGASAAPGDEIGRYLMRTACAFGTAWCDAGEDNAAAGDALAGVETVGETALGA